MKKFIIKLTILFLGITSGIYVSSKINLLTDVVKDYNMEDNITNNILDEYGEDNVKDELVLVNDYYDGFVVDLRYSTKDNVTKTKLYDNSSLVYMQKNTMDKLIQANEELRTKGYRIKIWDAYRPLSVQKKLWAAFPNASYIANPFTTGSNHNRGAAVDITLVTLKGKPVEMPSGFDDFTGKGRRNAQCSNEAKKNVDLLTEIMIKNGFETIESEWWHYDDSDSEKYDIKDYKFRDLLKK